MFTRVTPMGISISGIESLVRKEKRPVSEFFFTIATSYGQEYVFRYQRDASGEFNWHLYKDMEGGEITAMSPAQRNSLGRLPLDFIDSDIDALLRKITPSPLLTTYVVVLGVDGVDFVVFPMSRKISSFMRAFLSLSQGVISARIAHKLAYEMVDARQFTLDKEKKAQLQNPDSELALLMGRLKKDGFYMYAAGNPDDPMSFVPPFIKLEMLAAGSDMLCLERRSQVRNALFLTCKERPVARIDNVQGIFDQYELMAANYKSPARRHSPGKREKDLLADWQRKRDDEKWDNVRMD